MFLSQAPCARGLDGGLDPPRGASRCRGGAGAADDIAVASSVKRYCFTTPFFGCLLGNTHYVSLLKLLIK